MNYTELVADIQNFMEDDSTEFQNSIPDIITQAEAMIFSRLPSLPCYRQSSPLATVDGQANYTISNARMIRQIDILSASGISYLNHRIDSYLRDYWPDATATGTPVMYSTKSASTSGITVTFAPTPNSIIITNVDFIAPETGLSSGNANSWIGDNAEQVLLSACLYESSSFLKAPDGVNLYKAQFDEAIALFQQEMQRNYTAEYEGGI
jgi:hypothetical protein